MFLLKPLVSALLPGLLFLAVAPKAKADPVCDWNRRVGQVIVDAKMGTPPAIRVMAYMHGAVERAVVAAHASAHPASVDAAVAAASRGVLVKMIPGQQAAIDSAYQSALATLGDGPAQRAGVELGEKAALATFAARGDDGAAAPEAYRPHASAGSYVPTQGPAVPHWGQRKTWILRDAAELRPGPPPALSSDAWARDYNEIKSVGAKASTARTAEQTEIARFWEFSLPQIYTGPVCSALEVKARLPGRSAALLAAVTQGMDDAMIAVWDAKYHYNFWRPVTAIRNGDADGHPGTERDASWTSFIDAPLHPEYPSAHSILAGTVGTLLQAEFGAAMPTISAASPTAKGAVRQWARAEDFMREVANARVYEGIHFRNSTDTGLAMGRRLGQMAAARLTPAASLAISAPR